ncbi:asparagine synthase (glutamine-hydrolyzing) [Lentisphaera marina]|uniref:asparagine synthase (glutamine-hydrolyzing) n=1 Tax=Lentisphaera marina TaxID=1111041 RepID=UPI00236692BA|nr:asparagine synthase (glutamine-hydrolyzing) [Lentisphaera marina]MDD7985747.1 asparagine synthase (glutamine-hydrolyzing) [Lentisphaera marina]
MCGIAGMYSASGVDPQQLEAMAEAILHRGPDGRGFHHEAPVGLVHTRLSIIDLEGGAQPIYNEDRSLALVCNGEIYDFERIRQELQQGGHSFSTSSDSEVILHLYEEKGAECVKELNGMFAFAIVHLDSGEIFMARDRMGQKPLFYARAGNKFAFASGPRALKCLSWVDDSLDDTSLSHFLEFAYVPQPDSIYKGIKKLPAGQWMRWAKEELCFGTYWDYTLNETYSGSYEEACDEMRQLFSRSVERRLVADVPLGVFLSGGVDSSLVAAAAAHEGRKIKTFSIGFPEKKFDERDYALKVSKHLNTDHHFLEVKADSFDQFAKIVREFEEPFADVSMIPTYLLCAFAREQVTVCLSGDGADELFGGYQTYQRMHSLRRLNALPPGLRKFGASLLKKFLPPRLEERTVSGKLHRLCDLAPYSGLGQYRRLISRCSPDLKNDLLKAPVGSVIDSSEAVLSRYFRGDGLLAHRLMELDCKTYMADDILVKVDRASMANSLEVRSPFLDPEILEFSRAIPFHFKQGGGVRKRILCDTFVDWLPRDIFYRTKMGFGMPVARWLRSEWREPMHEVLLNSPFIKEYFNISSVERLMDEHCESRADHSSLLFSLLVLSLWSVER